MVSPLRLRWVKGICVFKCILPPALFCFVLLNDRGLLRATAVTRGMERTPNKSQHTKLILEKNILLPLLPGFELATFRSRLRRSNQQANPAPGYRYRSDYRNHQCMDLGSAASSTGFVRKSSLLGSCSRDQLKASSLNIAAICSVLFCSNTRP